MDGFDDTDWPYGYGMCCCGCGQKTLPATRNRGVNIKGEPTRRLHGHSRKHRKSEVEFLLEERGYQTPCRIWQRNKSGGGYGYRWSDGAKRRVHVLEWEAVNGPVPPGLVLDHLCRQRDCCEPSHLEAVTKAVNSRRGMSAKLTAEQVGEIRKLLRQGQSRTQISARFGVHPTTIGDIRAGRSWNDGDPRLNPRRTRKKREKC